MYPRSRCQFAANGPSENYGEAWLVYELVRRGELELLRVVEKVMRKKVSWEKVARLVPDSRHEEFLALVLWDENEFLRGLFVDGQVKEKDRDLSFIRGWGEVDREGCVRWIEKQSVAGQKRYKEVIGL